MFKLRFWTHGAGSYFLAIAVALTIRWAFMEAYVIPSGSMLPSLLINDHIFVNKSVYGFRYPFSEKCMIKKQGPQRGEVIVFKKPQNKSIFYIKRVVGIPGDIISYENGSVVVNGDVVGKIPADPKNPEHMFNYNFLRDVDFQATMNFATKGDYEHHIESLGNHDHDVLLRKGEFEGVVSGPFEVAEGQLFVMGDNRNHSQDSRMIGTIPQDYVLGRAMFVWLSCETKLPIISFLCNPFTVRYSRLFHSIH